MFQTSRTDGLTRSLEQAQNENRHFEALIFKTP